MLERVVCVHCKRDVTSRQLKRHQQTRICLLAQGKNMTETHTPCPHCNKQLTSAGHRTHSCKLKPIEKSTNNINNLKKKLAVAEATIKALKKKPQQPITINVINNGSGNITNNIVTNVLSADAMEYVSDKISFRHLAGGAQAMANLTIDNLDPNTIICTDYSRKNFIFKTDEKEIIDKGGDLLVKELCKGYKPGALNVIKYAKDNVEFDDPKLVKAFKNLEEIRDGARGNTSGRFCTSLSRTIASRTSVSRSKQKIPSSNLPSTSLDEPIPTEIPTTTITQDTIIDEQDIDDQDIDDQDIDEQDIDEQDIDEQDIDEKDDSWENASTCSY